MKVSKVEWAVSKLSKMSDTGALSFDLPIQRKEDIWDDKRKSMLIHSVLAKYPIPPLYAVKRGKDYSFLDGKQRLMTILQFMNGSFKLHKDTPMVNGIEIADKSFVDLSEEMRIQIEDERLELIKVEDATDTEIEELFYRLNNGVPLKQIETTRAVLGNRILRYVEDIARTPFFANKINVSKTARKRYVDQELVLQVLTLVNNADTGFSGKELEEFVKKLKSSDLREELRSKVQNASYYLNEAFPKKGKFLKKLHVPMLVKLVLDVQGNQLPIFPSEFGDWAKGFFENLPEEYKNASLQGSARKENVQTRLRVMSTHFARYLQDTGKAQIKYTPPLEEILSNLNPVLAEQSSQSNVG